MATPQQTPGRCGVAPNHPWLYKESIMQNRNSTSRRRRRPTTAWAPSLAQMQAEMRHQRAVDAMHRVARSTGVE